MQLNYWLAVTIIPMIVISLNIGLRLHTYKKQKAIIYGITDASFHLIGYAFILLSYQTSGEFDSGWALVTILTFAIPCSIIFSIWSIWLKVQQ